MRCRLAPTQQGDNPVFRAKTFTFGLIKGSTASPVFDLPPRPDRHILSDLEINNDKKKKNTHLKRSRVQFLGEQFFW